MANDRVHDDLRDRPTGELLRQLSQETTTLVRQELDLAKAEMAEKGKKAGLGAGMFGAAGIVGLLARGARRRRRLRSDRRDPRPRRAVEDQRGDSARARADSRNREGGRAMGEDPQ